VWPQTTTRSATPSSNCRSVSSGVTRVIAPRLHPDLTRAGGAALEVEHAVGVAADERRADCTQPLERLDRHRSARDVAASDDPVHALRLDLREDRVERRQVPVDVVESRDAHALYIRTMRLEPLYRLTFSYTSHWDAQAGGVEHFLGFGEGRCEGRINGAFRGANHARRRPEDRVFEPDYHGVIETEDGAAIVFHLTGYGLPDDGRAIVSVKHVTGDERYAWLNRTLCAGSAEVGERTIVLDVAELVWEPLET